MTHADRAEYVVRDTVMKMLSSEELARVSNAEDAFRLEDGEEYLDLTQLEKGVLLAAPATDVAVGQVLPRSAVHAETWNKILAQIKH